MKDDSLTNLTPNAPILRIRAILFREGDLWVGQCIEYDIGAQAKTLTELHKKLELTVLFELQESLNRHGVPFKGIRSAPSSFADMWNKQSGEFRPASDVASHNVSPSLKPTVGLELALSA
jgi:hypothetical protein